MVAASRTDPLIGLLAIVITLSVLAAEWLGISGLARLSAAVTLPLAGLLYLRVGLSRRIYLIVAVAMAAIALATRQDWFRLVATALQNGAYFVGFFSSLLFLRYMTEGSAALRRCAEYLADQPPGRRYGALTLGASAFTLVLNLGALVFLGQLVVQNQRPGEDPARRAIRERRMLLAVQRGFTSCLAWSPLALAMALSTTLVPGGSWPAAVLPALVNAAILVGVGWGQDWLFKPRPTGTPAAVPAATERWTVLLPLLALLLLLMATVGGLQYFVTSVRTISVIMLVVPSLAIVLILFQSWRKRPLARLGEIVRRYASTDLAAQRSELLLLFCAAFMGSLGAALLSPILQEMQFDFFGLSGRAILIAMIWLVPLSGLVGVNPIMAMSLIAPLLPPPAAMGVEPHVVVVALTGGWVLSSATSPFTAATIFIASFAKVDPVRVGMVWNGPYVLICGLLISAWVGFLAS